jgi:RNA polymerase sigma-70 factor (family 1)
MHFADFWFVLEYRQVDRGKVLVFFCNFIQTKASMHSYLTYSDVELFVEMSGGNEHAFDAFFYRYNTKVYYFTLHIVDSEMVAEELVHDVFLKIWLNRSGLRNVSNPGNYLFVAAKNHALNQLEKIANERKGKRQIESRPVRTGEDPEEEFFYRESLALVTRAINELPEQPQIVFHLSRERGLSREEIAEQLGLSPNTVKNHLGAARKSIHQYLHAHGKVVAAVLSLHYFFAPH